MFYWIVNSILVLVALIVLLLAVLAANSRKRTSAYQGNILPPVNHKSVMVHSRAENLSYYIAPLDYCDVEIAKRCAEQSDWRLVRESDAFLQFEVSTALFGFVDDVFLEFDAVSKQIYVCSKSRIGKTDFGSNRRRIERFRKLLAAHMPQESAEHRSGTVLNEDAQTD